MKIPTAALTLLLVAPSLLATVSPPVVGEYTRGVEALEDGRTGRAVWHLRKHLAEYPEDHKAWRTLALAYDRLHLTESAADALTRALTLQPDDVSLMEVLVRLQVRRGETVEAMATAQTLLAADEENTEALRWGGRAFYREGELESAEKWLLRSTEAVPDDAGAWNTLGLIYLRTKRPGEAKGAFLRATELIPGAPWAHNNLGLAHERLGEWERAWAEYNTAAALAPRNEGYARNRGRIESALARLSR
jgi:Flp pilus assembly protein TadD